jgi:hypothetical protein
MPSFLRKRCAGGRKAGRAASKLFLRQSICNVVNMLVRRETVCNDGDSERQCLPAMRAMSHVRYRLSLNGGGFDASEMLIVS